MHRLARNKRPLMVTCALAALALAGCGSDEEETTSELAQTTAPTTAPLTSAPAAPTSAPNPCTTAKAISNLKFTGILCAQAAAVADEWNERIDECNTIDNPSSPEGYNRTCTVQAYTCRAKRDTKSDARFVACAKGGATIRFTWAPA